MPFPTEVIAKSRNGGLTALLTPGVHPMVAIAIRAMDKAVYNSPDTAAETNAPFDLQIKFDGGSYNEDRKYIVQVCSSSTLMELAHAIHCELNVPAQCRRLVVMGRTIYNYREKDGSVNENKTLHAVCNARGLMSSQERC